MRVIAPCSREMLAWVRYRRDSQAGDKTAKVDIDLCDEQGNISAQMRGISWQLVSLEIVEPVVESAASVVRKEIALVPQKQTLTAPVERKKPKGITLVAPELLSCQEMTLPPKPAIALSTAAGNMPVVESVAAAVAAVKLYYEGQGIFSIQVEAVAEPQTEEMAHLLQAIEQAQRKPP